MLSLTLLSKFRFLCGRDRGKTLKFKAGRRIWHCYFDSATGGLSLTAFVAGLTAMSRAPKAPDIFLLPFCVKPRCCLQPVPVRVRVLVDSTNRVAVAVVVAVAVAVVVGV